MTLKDIPEICHCGQKMHLSDAQKVMIQMFGKDWPKFKEVKILNHKSYKVPAYYIILHGLKGIDLITGLGFPEIKKS